MPCPPSAQGSAWHPAGPLLTSVTWLSEVTLLLELPPSFTWWSGEWGYFQGVAFLLFLMQWTLDLKINVYKFFWSQKQYMNIKEKVKL